MRGWSGQIPSQCRERKQHLVEEEGPVRDFLQELGLQRTDIGTNLVKSSDNYQKHPEMRRDGMNLLECRKLVDRILDANNYHDEKRIKGVKHHTTWVGWKDQRLKCS